MKIKSGQKTARAIFWTFLVVVCLSYMFYIVFVVGTPEKAVIWHIFREGDCSYSEAKQAEINLVKAEGGQENIYQTKIGDDERLWQVSSFGSNWFVTEYTPEQKFSDAMAKLTRQDMVETCIQYELQESSEVGVAELWKKYALMSDDQVTEQYKRSAYTSRL